MAVAATDAEHQTNSNSFSRYGLTTTTRKAATTGLQTKLHSILLILSQMTASCLARREARYIHQSRSREPRTFWAGLSAIVAQSCWRDRSEHWPVRLTVTFSPVCLSPPADVRQTERFGPPCRTARRLLPVKSRPSRPAVLPPSLRGRDNRSVI